MSRWLRRCSPLCLAVAALGIAGDDGAPGPWPADVYGNHRAVVRVEGATPVASARIPWRRRDSSPQTKNLMVVSAKSGKRVANVVRRAITREAGEIVFEAIDGPGEYYVYYLPWEMQGRSNYPTVSYPAPEETADPKWVASLDTRPPAAASFVGLEARDAFQSFEPMEVIASAEEKSSLLARWPGADFLLFPEDRTRPIKMTGDLPLRWIESVPNGPVRLEAARGEFHAFQIGLYARRGIEQIGVAFQDLMAANGERIPAAALRCFNLGGVDWEGRDFRRRVDVAAGRVQALWLGVQVPESAAPGRYQGRLAVSAAGAAPQSLPVVLEVSAATISAAGDDEPWRLSRLRWLDSRLAQDDGLVPPYTPVTVRGTTLSVLGRDVTLAPSGLPESIVSRFAPEMTHLAGQGRELLAAPIALTVEAGGGSVLKWSHTGVRMGQRAEGMAAWTARGKAGRFRSETRARLEFDGCLEYQIELTATGGAEVDDVRLEVPVGKEVARYMMGLGRKGGLRPAFYDWAWKVENNQDSFWIGDVNAGLQVTLKDDRYVRPLNTNFYTLKPLLMPASWANQGQGYCRFVEAGGAFLARCGSGPRRWKAGETQRFDLRLLLTPFHPLNTKAQWSTRFYHAFKPIPEVAATGANVVNVHHANAVNPYINYPFLRPAEMKAYVDEGHRAGMKVKIYYTVRELTNRAPELFALRSLGHEVLAGGPGGGWSWLQEHLEGDYIAGWFVPELEDAALITSGVSRWHNFYVEGLAWLVRNVGIDGLYIDDVAFDRTTMKRVRKVLDRGRPGALIDLHSANQFNPRDGFASSANLYLEHFPFLDRLWFGEYFDYNSGPDYWLTEISGIPFGLMGEMLEGGGNPWRGMVYGMTTRLPWAGDPRPLWKAWDAFGMAESRMIGYWVEGAPVRTDRADVLATTYVGQGQALLALASWAPEAVEVRLTVDWKSLGIDPLRARIRAPAIQGLQEEASFRPDGPIPLARGRGWLLVVDQ